MKKAMITIEVLISMVILFLVVATSFSNIKFFNMLNDKKSIYEEEYINILSIKDKLSSSICKTTQISEGLFNNYKYIATCTKVRELRTYIKDSEDDALSGNKGNYLIKLYNIELNIKHENISKRHSYNLTVNKKLSP